MNLLFDIGGTSTRIAISDGSGLKILGKYDTSSKPKEIVSTITKAAKAYLPESIVGGIAGRLDENGILVFSPNLSGWVGSNISQQIRSNLQSLSIKVQIYNDADLGALGEATFGSGKHVENFGYLIIGTGLGGALIKGRTIASGELGFEPGHMLSAVCLEDGQSEYTIEELLGGAGVARRFARPPKELVDDEIWTSLSQELGRLVANLSLSWSTKTFILGGGMVYKNPGYNLKIVEEVANHYVGKVLYDQKITVLGGDLDDEANLFGALAKC